MRFFVSVARCCAAPQGAHTSRCAVGFFQRAARDGRSFFPVSRPRHRAVCDGVRAPAGRKRRGELPSRPFGCASLRPLTDRALAPSVLHRSGSTRRDGTPPAVFDRGCAARSGVPSRRSAQGRRTSSRYRAACSCAHIAIGSQCSAHLAFRLRARRGASTVARAMHGRRPSTSTIEPCARSTFAHSRIETAGAQRAAPRPGGRIGGASPRAIRDFREAMEIGGEVAA